MEHRYCAEYRHVRIRPLKECDIENLRKWRNTPELSEFLRPIGTISSEAQKNWFENYRTDESIYSFAIEEIKDLNRVVGSVAIYDFNGDKAEIGKIVVGDPEAKGKKIGYYALMLAACVCYQKCGVQELLGEVHEDNIPAKTNDLRLGFLVEGKKPFINGGYELIMRLPKEHFESIHPELEEISVFEE